MKTWLKIVIGISLLSAGIGIWLWLDRQRGQVTSLQPTTNRDDMLSLIAQIASTGSGTTMIVAADNKVDKEANKGLSTNDYTNDDQAKLTNLALVASSGNYSDLSGKPSIPVNASDVGAYTTTQTDDLLKGKITFVSASSMDEVNAAATGTKRLFIELDNGSSADAELYYYSPRVGRYKVFIFK